MKNSLLPLIISIIALIISLSIFLINKRSRSTIKKVNYKKLGCYDWDAFKKLEGLSEPYIKREAHKNDKDVSSHQRHSLPL